MALQINKQFQLENGFDVSGLYLRLTVTHYAVGNLIRVESEEYASKEAYKAGKNKLPNTLFVAQNFSYTAEQRLLQPDVTLFGHEQFKEYLKTAYGLIPVEAQKKYKGGESIINENGQLQLDDEGKPLLRKEGDLMFYANGSPVMETVDIIYFFNQDGSEILIDL